MCKTALITGGNSGIGYATAKSLKEKGYKVYISGRSSERVNQAAEELGAIPLVADMADLEGLQKVASCFAEDGLDALVNNAAIAIFKPLSAVTDDEFTLYCDTNIRGPLALIRNLLPALEKKQGSVCNISSAIVNNGLPAASLYAATKGALEAMTRSLALELAPVNVRVNSVSPGAIDTPIIHKVGLPPEMVDAIRAQQEALIPLKRFGRSEEVAEVIIAQLESSYVTGSIWSVDGGVDAY